MSDALAFFVTELSSADDKLAVVQQLDGLLDKLKSQESLVRDDLLPVFHDILVSDEDDGCIWELAINGLPALYQRFPKLSNRIQEFYLRILEYDEKAIRDAGLKGLNKIMQQSSKASGDAVDRTNVEDLVSLYETLIVKAKSRSSPYAKVSSAELFSQIFEHLPVDERQSILPSCISLASDDHPLTRKSVAACIMKIVQHSTPEEILDTIYPAVLTGWKDEFVEQVRVDSCASLMLMARKLNAENYIVPVLSEISTEPSWRIKLAWLSHVYSFMQGCSDPTIQFSFCWKNIVNMMNDTITEVANKAFETVHACFKHMTPDIYAELLIPKLTEIMTSGVINEKDEEACCSICDIIADGCAYLDKSQLLEFTTQLISHPMSTVRTRLISHLPVIGRVLGPQSCLSLMWSAVEDKQWRVRAAIAAKICELADYVEVEPILKLLITTLLDLCDQVRCNAVDSIQAIVRQHNSSVSTQLIDLLLILWQLNHKASQGGTGETPTTCVANSPLLSEILSHTMKRNICSYIITRILLKAFTAAYPVVDGSSQRTIINDILLASTSVSCDI